MATVGLTRSRGATGRLLGHLRDPLHRSGYALVSASAVTSALGMVFWIIAARLFPAGDVGRASATIAAMVFVANAATLGLRNGFVRFLPTAGDDASRFIGRSYALCVGVAAVGAVVFLWGQPVWASGLDYLRDGRVASVLFVVATATWVIFVLQDSVLTGLRLATWVPLENAIYAVSKIVLLFALVSVPAWGIFAAWSIPSIVLAVPVNILIFRHLRRRHIPTAHGGVTMPEVMRFAAGDHVAAFLWLGTTELLGLVVLSRLGATAAAVYFLAFSIAYALYLVTSNVTNAFVVEATLHPGRIDVLLGQALRQTARLVVPGAAAAIIAAPLLLRLFGPVYERLGTDLLRLLLLSALPQMFVGLAVGFARARRRIGLVVVVFAVTAACLFTGAILGSSSMGLVAVGWAWLLTQSVLAVVLFLTVLRGLWIHRLDGPALRTAAGARRAWRQARSRRAARRVVPDTLRSAGWDTPERVDVLRSLNDVIVARVRIRGSDRVAKIARSPAGRAGLRRNADNLRRLSRIDGLEELDARIPRVLESRRTDDGWLVMETSLPGVSLEHGSEQDRAAASTELMLTVDELHRVTGTWTEFNGEMTRQWVRDPIDTLRKVPSLARFAEELDALDQWLRAGLVGRPVRRSWIAGDLCAANVLVDPDEASHVTGLIDWENARPDGFAELDLAHLWLTEQPGEVGSAVLGELEHPVGWTVTGGPLGGTSADTVDEDSAADGPPGALATPAVLVLAWLAHVAAGLDRAQDNPHSPIWLARNVENVLAAVPRFPSPDISPAATIREPVTETPGHSEPGAVGPTEASSGLRRPTRSEFGSVAMIAVALAAWIAGAGGLDPRTMSEYGLVSLLNAPMLAGLALLTVGFALALRGTARTWVLGLYVSALIAMFHATPPAIYGTLRYSWSWKHVGVVEYITRTGSVDTTIENTPIYHSWPGFFGAGALLTEAIGAADAVRIAMWAPLFFNLMNAAVLRFLLRALTDDRRVVWLAVWLFFTTNWVGQDYFSPQAMSYVMYLALLGVLLRSYWRSSSGLRVLAPQLPERGALVAAIVLLAALAMSHQITPMMAVIALAALFATRRIHGWYLPAIATALVVVWALTIGRGILSDGATSLFEALGRPWANVEETLDKTRTVADSQMLVSRVGRLIVVALGGLAAVGAVRLWRRGRLSPTVVVLTLCPAALPLLTEFGGEIVFRMFIFAAPGLVLLAASAIQPDADPRRGASQGRTLATIVVTLSFGLAFLVPYYGKDRNYFFTPAEIEASAWVADNAPEGSLLVEGSRNYPGQFRNYEKFVYVPISREDPEVWRRILGDPEQELYRWLDNPDYPATYVLLTRSQQLASDLEGPLPRGALDDVEEALRRSPRFEVAFETADAAVFVLADTPEEPS